MDTHYFVRLIYANRKLKSRKKEGRKRKETKGEPFFW
jgi:hypothetical protein